MQISGCGFSMTDWRGEVKQRLADLKLEPAREAEIVEELAQHLEQRYSELLTGGANDNEASRVALAELSENPRLANELQKVKQTMTQGRFVLGSHRGGEMLGAVS